MKTFIPKTRPHIIFIGIILLVLYLFMKENYDERHIYQVSDKKIENAIVVIGDSKSLTDFYDSIINENTKIPFYNLSSWGAFPYNILKEIKPYQIKDCEVFLVLSVRIFAQPDTINLFNRNHFNFSENFNSSSISNELLAEILHMAEGKWEYERLKSGGIVFKNLVRPYSSYDIEGDSSYYSDLMRSEKYHLFKEQKIKHFIELFNVLSENNRVRIIDLPERILFEEIAESYESDIFKRIELETGSKIIDFDWYPDSLFYDSHHLNKKGAIVLTKEFVSDFVTPDKYPD